MFSKMMELVNRTDSHPLTAPQQKDVLDYAKSLSRRFQAARQVEQSEPKILDAAVRHIQESSADLGDFTEAGWESSANDLRFVLRTVTQAMLLDDDRFAGDVAVGSLTKQFAYLDLPAEATRDVVAGLQRACGECLPPQASEALTPYFPAAPAVAA